MYSLLNVTLIRARVTTADSRINVQSSEPRLDSLKFRILSDVAKSNYILARAATADVLLLEVLKEIAEPRGEVGSIAKRTDWMTHKIEALFAFCVCVGRCCLEQCFLSRRLVKSARKLPGR